jgi:mannose-6-phosphate isomerase-like protein (cupin superfamily)
MRRIVTGVNGAGKSYVVSNEVIPDGGFTTLWQVDVELVRRWIAGVDAEKAAKSIEPPPGSSRWVIASMPPEAESRPRAQPIPGLDERGFHTTRTVDYDLVLEGPLILELDQGSVELQTGDVVVQQATRHAWRNPGQKPAKLLAVLTTLPG